MGMSARRGFRRHRGATLQIGGSNRNPVAAHGGGRRVQLACQEQGRQADQSTPVSIIDALAIGRWYSRVVDASNVWSFSRRSGRGWRSSIAARAFSTARSSGGSDWDRVEVISAGRPRPGGHPRVHLPELAPCARLRLQRITASVERLRRFPDSGQVVPERRSARPAGARRRTVRLVVCLRNGFTPPPVADKTAKPAVFGRRLQAAVSGPRKLNRKIIQGTRH